MVNSMLGGDDERLDSLFRAYRDACPAPEANPNFMPELWQRIESRKSFTFAFRRMANAFVTAAVALSIALGVYISIGAQSLVFSSQTYVEALDEADSIDTPEIVSPIRLEIIDQRPVN